MAHDKSMDLLIVDDDSDFRRAVAQRFRRRGHHVMEAGTPEKALEHAAEKHFDVALVDLVMPGMSGLELLEKLKESDPDSEVVVLTGYGSIDTAVDAMKRGAYHYVTKPCPLAELEVLLAKAYERSTLGKENRQLRAALQRAEPEWEMVGESAAMRAVKRLVERAAPTESSVLVQGESGTGKELVARALHQRSQRWEKPLVVINCAALQETLLESELFGHERGAFTGATVSKAGLFDVADGGTLFIDEIGEMSGGLQAKLLRVLEDGRYRPVGSIKERRADVRVIVATNRDLAEEVKGGHFRDDLFFRINVLMIALPPLRQRRDDIPLLVEHFLRLGSTAPWNVSSEAMQRLVAYNWPGNVRELANCIQRAQILADDHTILPKDLPPSMLGSDGAVRVALKPEPQPDSLTELEAHHVADVLRREGWNKARAARALGISRRSLYRLLEKHKDTIPDAAAAPPQRSEAH
jgi:DNA-binding NtrC family response regulator